MSLLTSQGNLKSQTITNEVLIDKRTHKIVKYWGKVGFPYIDTGEKYRQDKFDAFLKVDDMQSLDFNNRSFKFNNAAQRGSVCSVSSFLFFMLSSFNLAITSWLQSSSFSCSILVGKSK